MIRYATLSDLPSLRRLWHHAFGDSFDFIDRFVDQLFAPDRCLVDNDDDGEVVSMLYLLPAVVHLEAESYRLWYVYGCATDRSRRGKGSMTRLLDFAAREGDTREVDALVLIPASSELERYYASRGYVCCSSVAEWRFRAGEAGATDDVVAPLEVASLQALRATLIAPDGVVEWPTAHTAFQLDYLRALGGGALCITSGCDVSYLIYAPSATGLSVVEFASSAGERRFKHLAAMLRWVGVDDVRVRSHCTVATAGATRRSTAMIRPLRGWSEKYAVEKLFLNLGLSD